MPSFVKYGIDKHKYAYTSKRNHRDVLAIDIYESLLLFDASFLVLVLCDYGSGAFGDSNSYATNSLLMICRHMS